MDDDAIDRFPEMTSEEELLTDIGNELQSVTSSVRDVSSGLRDMSQILEKILNELKDINLNPRIKSII